jgi:hypothetical protein
LGSRERLGKSERSPDAPWSYASVVAQIRKLGDLPPGWNSYRASKIEENAQRKAITFVNSLANLGRSVPLPSVAPTPNGGVALHWYPRDLEVEIIFLPRGGEFSVARRKSEEVVEEGSIDSLDLLKDIVGRYVVSR